MIDSPVLEIEESCKVTKVVHFEVQGYHMRRISGRFGIINIHKILCRRYQIDLN